MRPNIRKHLHINKEYLIREYIDKNRSAYDIAKENGLRAKFIIERLKMLGIPTRNIKTSNSSTLSIEKRKKTCIKKYGVDNVSKSKLTIKKIHNNTDWKKHAKKTSEGLRRLTPEQWKDAGRKRTITMLQKYGVTSTVQFPDVKRKIRVKFIQRMQDQLIDGGQIYPAYNKNACLLIEKYGKENGYNFQHAMNGGEYHIKELGYWVDGYDKEKNVVIEVDENHHFDNSGNLLKEDVQRQIEIEKYLNCKFIRIKNN